MRNLYKYILDIYHIILISILFVKPILTNPARYIHMASYDDQISDESMTSESASLGVIHCGLMCIRSSNCSTYFFAPGSNTCRLVGQVLDNQANWNAEVGWNYFKVEGN